MEKEKLSKSEQKKQRDKLIDSVIGSLGEALEENFEEIDEVFEEQEPDSSAEAVEKEPRRIHRVFVILAVLLLFFSVIGVITTVNFIKNTTNDIVDQKALKDEFALFVFPVVMNDPPSFDSVDSLQPSTIISCAMWKIILTENTTNFRTDMGVMYVPAANVEMSANSIFGIRFSDHQTTYNFGMEFTYNEEENTYYIPENPLFHSYSPVITEIENVGELYVLTVEYMEPRPQAIAGVEFDNRPVKTMTYTVSRTRERMTINSIKFAETNPVS
ncbi:MAG: hypothetical protein FWD34_00935 [Oscillospiraceae bacterium]|nr:hypothetical protein [Oscillospiraceae bacterium]